MERIGYFFAASGTGGHIYPAVAVADALRARHPEAGCLFLGTERPLESQLVAGAGYPHVALPTDNLRAALRRPWRLWKSLHEARRLLCQHQPRVVIGCGGFGSVPVVFAAQRLGIPTVLLEQNAIPGRANRWLSRRAAAVCAALEESRSGFHRRTRFEVTGNPVRRSFVTSGLRECPAESPDSRPMLVVLGGSLGAGAINHDVLAGIRENPQLLSGWSILHQTGNDDYTRVADEYHRLGIAAAVQPHFDHLAGRLKKASLVISRGGGTTLAELACLGLPTIVVPWRGAADDHQLANALAYCRQGAALLAADSQQLPRSRSPVPTAERLWTVVTQLVCDAALRQRLGDAIRQVSRPDATERVLDVIESVAASHNR